MARMQDIKTAIGKNDFFVFKTHADEPGIQRCFVQDLGPDRVDSVHRSDDVRNVKIKNYRRKRKTGGIIYRKSTVSGVNWWQGQGR